MTRVLHVAASPMAERSHSHQAAQAFLDAWRARHPDHAFDAIDVWRHDLPHFDDTMIAAKFAVLRARRATPAQASLWARAVALAQRFDRADLFVFSLPMWNHGVPYRLKHFIDVVTLPGENWRWSRDTGYAPLLRDKRAVLVYSSANDFSGSAGAADAAYEDFQKPFMRQWLRFIGVEVAAELAVAPTLTDPETLQAAETAAADQARDLAARL